MVAFKWRMISFRASRFAETLKSIIIIVVLIFLVCNFRRRLNGAFGMSQYYCWFIWNLHQLNNFFDAFFLNNFILQVILIPLILLLICAY